jgi:hypothetical protein
VALSTFWPIFLFVAVEILARTPWPSGARWAALRWVGLLPVALVAALVSYRHLSGLLGFYGEDPITVAIGPLAVDGLMVMATGALLATASVVDTESAQATPEAPVRDAPATPVPDAPRVQPPARRPRRRAARATATTAATSGVSTAERVATVRAQHPEWTAPQIAEHLEISPRSARRYANVPTPTVPEGIETPAPLTVTQSDATQNAAPRAA